MDLGLFLKKKRIEAGITGTRLAERIGYSRVYISYVENGKTTGGLSFWNKIKGFYRLTPEEWQSITKELIERGGANGEKKQKG